MKRFTKIIAIMVLMVVVGANLVFVLPKPAQAQFVVSVPNLESMSIREWIIGTLKSLLKTVLFQGLMNALNYFTQKLAYDAAVWLASGGKGQGTLFEYKNWGDYMEDVALDTAGEFIGTLSEEEGWPIDLCQPTVSSLSGIAEDLMPQVTMNLQLGLADIYEPRPRCEWNQIAQNWDEFLSSNTGDQILAQFTRSMRPGEDGLGSALSLFEKVSSESAKKEEAAVQSRQEGQGVKSVETKVSGHIETPSFLVGEQFKQQTIDEPAKSTEQNVSGSLSISDSVLSMGLNIGSMFLNTLTSKLFGNLMNGFFDAGELVSEKKSLWNLGASTEPEGGRIAAEKIFADLLKPTFLEIANWNPLMEFTACPPERGANNCVLDSYFAAALTEAASGNPISVREAIKKGYLHENWPLIPLIDKSRSQDPNCFNYGYCAVNLSKLRKARIIPVGWEMAANLAKNNPSSPITLGEVIKNFNNSSSDYYHLIDPNWVLKMPATQCKMQVNGPTLASSEGDIRENVCVDTPSCLAEDEDGKCLNAWGYCTREKNVWRIDADSCEQQYSSCEGFTTRDKKKVAYLQNTMDYNFCNAGNVGCAWYSVAKNSNGSWNGEERIYLNKNATECKPAAAGCSDLIRKGSGVSANLVGNSSFEKDENEDNLPDNWTSIVVGSSYSEDGLNSYNGRSAVRVFYKAHTDRRLGMIVDGQGEYKQNISLTAGNYAVSYYAKQEIAGQSSQAYLDILSASTLTLPIHLSDSTNTNCTAYETGITLSAVPGDSYERKTCVFSLDDDREIVLTIRGKGGLNGVWVDAVQLEEGTRAIEYRETGYPWSVERVAMKIPPAYLGCTGGTGDNFECANYARVCKAENVGCELFTPTNGEPPISAKVSSEDFCPAECSGYALFRQEATNFENENPSVNLIPKTARSCSSDSEGCTEFTDTATGAVSYYSFLRRCGTEGGAPYYTWEGSDTAGYQLKSWNLKPGRPVGAETGNPPAYQSGFVDYSACTRTIFRAGTNPDCREFYDEAGNISYRLYSQTIVISPECKNLRKTLSDAIIAEQQSDCSGSGGIWSANGCLYNGYPAESVACSDEQNGCRAYGGNASRNIYVAFEENFESGSIIGWEQEGKVILSTESLKVAGHSLKEDGAGYVRKKFADLHEGGIYNLSFWAKGPVGGRLEVLFEAAGARGELPAISGLSIIGRETETSNLAFSPAENPKVNLATEWRLYNLGPVYFDRAPSENDYLVFYSINSSGVRTAMKNVFLDNIVLREVNQNIYLIKNSWKTPQSCDRTINNEFLPQAMVGCQEYKDSKNNLRYLKSFGSLCPESAAGCEAFIDTKNNETAFQEVWNAKCMLGFTAGEGGRDCVAGGKTYCHVPKGQRSCYYKSDVVLENECPVDSEYTSFAPSRICRDKSTLTVLKDETIYLINDSKMYCASDEIGCAKVGKPDIKRNLDNEELETTGVKYEDKILKLRPSLFGAILCNANELWCEEFKKDDGGIIYAKNPIERLCEYKENVLIGGIEISGWFKKDTELPCYDAHKELISTNANDDYLGWVGICDRKYSGCTTLVDPSDVTKDNPQGKPYFVIRNDKLDSKSCNGKVSKAEGCVLFRDLNDPLVKYRSDATYLRSQYEASGSAVTAVNCPNDEPNCKRCAFSLSRLETVKGGAARTVYYYDGFDHACQSDNDCLDVVRDLSLYPVGDGGFTSAEEVPPAKCVGTEQENFVGLSNDSNLIIKVTPDRECGEWLECRSTVTVWDEAGGKYKKVCTAVDLCREYKKTGENESKCVKFVEGDMDDKVLSETNYKNRIVGWSGMEYSGYSVPGKYQIDDLAAVEINEEKRLVKVLGSCSGADGSECRTVVSTGGGHVPGLTGKCFSGNCVRGIDNSVPQADLDSKRSRMTLVARSCRAYPEQTSPFPSTIAEWDKYLDEKSQGALSVKKQGYANASVCEETAWLDGNLNNIVDEGELVKQNCECSYQKATYGRGTLTKYFGYNQEFLPEGICFGGPRDGLPCAPGIKDVCGTVEEGGTCERLTRADKYLGLEGYCVEYDYSRTINGVKDEYPCLTWRPVEIPEGGQDVYNQYKEAGYNPPTAGVGKYFCVYGWGNALETPTGDPVPYQIAGGEISLNTVAGCEVGDWASGCPDWDYNEAFWGVGGITKGEIAAIQLRLLKFDHTVPTEEILTNFNNDRRHILSRAGMFTGIYHDPIINKDFIYWETRFSSDSAGRGIDDWETGRATLNTGHPLFVAPYRDGNTITDNTRFKYPVSGNSTCKDAKGSYFAIRALFNESGGFEGFWMAGCNSKGGDREQTVTFAPTIFETEFCGSLAQVVDSNGENRAYTHNLWEFGGFSLDPVKLSYYKNPAERTLADAELYSYDQKYTPFGSAASGFKSPPMTQGSDPWFIGPDGNGSPYFTTAYFTKNSTDAGSMLGCYVRPENERSYRVGSRTIKRGEGCFVTDTTVPLSSITGESPKDEIKKLFAKSYNFYSWQTGDNGSRYDLNYEAMWDEIPGYKLVRTIAVDSSVKNSRGNLRPVTNLGTLNSFSINDKALGIIEGFKSAEAIIRFYGWADKNQMPIRSRWVDWGDGSRAEEYFGKYKNKKPMCDTTNGIAEVGECRNFPGLTCMESADCPDSNCVKTPANPSFGNSPDACEEGFFEFAHTYTCSEEILEKMPVCETQRCTQLSELRNAVGCNISEVGELIACLSRPCDFSLGQTVSCVTTGLYCTNCKATYNGKNVCVYKPKLKITDNWGITTGGTDTSGIPEVSFRGSVLISQ